MLKLDKSVVQKIEMFFWGAFAGITYSEFELPHSTRLYVVGAVVVITIFFLLASRIKHEKTL